MATEPGRQSAMPRKQRHRVRRKRRSNTAIWQNRWVRAILATLVLVMGIFGIWSHWQAIAAQQNNMLLHPIASPVGSLSNPGGSHSVAGDADRLWQSLPSKLVMENTAEWDRETRVTSPADAESLPRLRNPASREGMGGSSCDGVFVSVFVAVDSRGVVCLTPELIGRHQSSADRSPELHREASEAEALRRAVGRLSSFAGTHGAAEALQQAAEALQSKTPTGRGRSGKPAGSHSEQEAGVGGAVLSWVDRGRCCPGGASRLSAELLTAELRHDAAQVLPSRSGGEDSVGRVCDLCDAASSCCLTGWACVACCAPAPAELVDAQGLVDRGLQAGVLVGRVAPRQSSMRLEQCARLCQVSSSATWHESQFK
jgi:hypothetical protein